MGQRQTQRQTQRQRQTAIETEPNARLCTCRAIVFLVAAAVRFRADAIARFTSEPMRSAEQCDCALFVILYPVAPFPAFRCQPTSHYHISALTMSRDGDRTETQTETEQRQRQRTETVASAQCHRALVLFREWYCFDRSVKSDGSCHALLKRGYSSRGIMFSVFFSALFF